MFEHIVFTSNCLYHKMLPMSLIVLWTVFVTLQILHMAVGEIDHTTINCNDLAYSDCSRSCGFGTRRVMSVCGPDHYEEMQTCCNEPCRGHGDNQLQMTVTCDSKVEVYVHGALRLTNSIWNQASTSTIGYTPVLVAIRCEDMRGIGGILASFSNGEVTDADWKCHNTYESGWNEAGFDDQHWEYALEIAQYPGGTYWGLVSGMAGKPFWIWTQEWPGGDREVYCRSFVRGVPTDSGCPVAVSRLCRHYPPYSESILF